jgi:hypothetical protein
MSLFCVVNRPDLAIGAKTKARIIAVIQYETKR